MQSDTKAESFDLSDGHGKSRLYGRLTTGENNGIEQTTAAFEKLRNRRPT